MHIFTVAQKNIKCFEFFTLYSNIIPTYDIIIFIINTVLQTFSTQNEFSIL